MMLLSGKVIFLQLENFVLIPKGSILLGWPVLGDSMSEGVLSSAVEVGPSLSTLETQP